MKSKLGQMVEEGISYDVILESGNPARAIINVANKRKGDIIVIGLRGLHGPCNSRTPGETSRAVYEEASCPGAVVTGT